MQLDDLKQTWSKELKMTTAAIDFDKVRKEADAFDRQVKSGVRIELFGCVGLIAVSILFLIWRPEASLLLKGCTLGMVAVCVFIGGKLLLSLRSKIEDDWTLASRIDRQIEKREKEKKMLGSSFGWYVAPMYVVVMASSWAGFAERTGSYVPDMGLLTYWLGGTVIFGSIYFYNQKRINTKIQPVLDKLYALRRELQEE